MGLFNKININMIVNALEEIFMRRDLEEFVLDRIQAETFQNCAEH